MRRSSRRRRDCGGQSRRYPRNRRSSSRGSQYYSSLRRTMKPTIQNLVTAPRKMQGTDRSQLRLSKGRWMGILLWSRSPQGAKSCISSTLRKERIGFSHLGSWEKGNIRNQSEQQQQSESQSQGYLAADTLVSGSYSIRLSKSLIQCL